MGLFSKRSKSRSKGSGATSATDDYPSQGSQGKLAASPHSLDGADFQGNGVNSGVYSVDDDQDGNAKGGTGNWVDQAANAADMGSQVFPNTADKYLGFGSVTIAGQEQSLVAHSLSATTAAAGEMTVKQAAQEVAIATVSAALVAGGVSTVVAPVLAVVIVVGHVIVRGATRYVYKQVRVRADQRAHVEQLRLNQSEAPDHFTMVINGLADDGRFNAFLSLTDDASYTLVDASHLRGLSKLIAGGRGDGCVVRDMGGFTEGAPRPLSVRLSMPDVLSLIRQSWDYESFSQTKCGTMTVMLLRSRRRKSTRLRIAWQNSAPLDACEAMILTEKEWKATKFSAKTKPLPEGFADVDVALDRSLVFV